VANTQPLIALLRARTVVRDAVLEPVLGDLDVARVVLFVVVGVDVEVRNVVAEIGHVLLAAGVDGAGRVRWAHVCGDLTQDVAESHFVHPHLILAVDGGDLGEVEMCPGVRGDLVAFSVDPLDGVGVLLVDTALVDVGAGHEEGGLGVVGFEEVENVLGEVSLRAIVISQGYSSRFCTVIDSVTAIGDGAEFVTRDG
jgi:hypothetical protein